MNELQKLALKCLNAGISVLVTKKEENTYFSFYDGSNIGYVQKAELGGGFDFSQLNKPSKKDGRGIRLISGGEATLSNIEIALNSYNPAEKETLQNFIKRERRFWENYGPINKNEIEKFIK